MPGLDEDEEEKIWEALFPLSYWYVDCERVKGREKERFCDSISVFSATSRVAMAEIMRGG